jgi:hypothetical protein
MFQPKARRAVSVLLLTAALSLAPLASASAAAEEAADGISLLAQVEAGIVLLWDALKGTWSDVGPRMDDNG